MENLLSAIACINEYQISDVLDAVLDRYSVLYPDWEVSTLSIPKYLDRNQQIDRAIELLTNMKR